LLRQRIEYNNSGRFAKKKTLVQLILLNGRLDERITEQEYSLLKILDVHVNMKRRQSIIMYFVLQSARG